jgi:hypothetical protein
MVNESLAIDVAEVEDDEEHDGEEVMEERALAVTPIDFVTTTLTEVDSVCGPLS